MKAVNSDGYKKAAQYVYRATRNGQPLTDSISSLPSKFGISANVSAALLKNEVLVKVPNANGKPLLRWNPKYGLKDVSEHLQGWTKEIFDSYKVTATEATVSTPTAKRKYVKTAKIIVTDNPLQKSMPMTSGLSKLSQAKSTALKATQDYINVLQNEANYIKSLLEN